jgi:hypothetical protein
MRWYKGLLFNEMLNGYSEMTMQGIDRLIAV